MQIYGGRYWLLATWGTPGTPMDFTYWPGVGTLATERQVEVHEMASGKSMIGTATMALHLEADFRGPPDFMVVDDSTYMIGVELSKFKAHALCDERSPQNM